MVYVICHFPDWPLWSFLNHSFNSWNDTTCLSRCRSACIIFCPSLNSFTRRCICFFMKLSLNWIFSLHIMNNSNRRMTVKIQFQKFNTLFLGHNHVKNINHIWYHYELFVIKTQLFPFKWYFNFKNTIKPTGKYNGDRHYETPCMNNVQLEVSAIIDNK